MIPTTSFRSLGFQATRYALLTAALATSFCAIDAEAQLMSPTRRFQRTFGTSASERTVAGTTAFRFGAHPLERAKDGGYLIVGTKDLYQGSKTITLRTTIDGNPVGLAQTYVAGGSGNDGADIHATSDGGYVVLGNREVEIPVGMNIPGAIVVTKVDATGSVSWSRSYGTDPYREQGYAIQQTGDGGYIVAGYMVDESDDVGDVFLMKLNASGGIQWQRAYNNFTWNYAAYSVQQTNDGGYIVAGKVARESINAFMMKVDANGAYQWYRDFGSASTDDVFYSVAKCGDGGYIASGKRGDDMYLVKVHSTGLIHWSKTYNGPTGGSDVAYDVKRMLGDNYMVAGQINGNKASLMRLDNSGNVTWAKGYAPPGTTTSAMSVVSTDKGYALGGEISTNGNDFYLVKTDGNGDSYCNSETVTMTPTTHTGDGNHIVLHAMADKPVYWWDGATVTGISFIQVLLCYSITDPYIINGATLSDKLHHHTLGAGIAVADAGSIADPLAEPVVLDGHSWTSEGIWVRSSQDEPVSDREVGSLYANEFRHERPILDGTTNYIYVPITNSGTTATEPGTLEVYWSFASTNLVWPTHWDGYVNDEDITLGDLAGSADIPSIPVGGLYVAEIPWDTPNGDDLGNITHPSIAFLARFVSDEDPMTTPEGENTEENAINNNNIIWRNEVIVEGEDMEVGNLDGEKEIIVRNTTGDATTSLTFSIPSEERGINPLLVNGGVIVDLGMDLYVRWKAAGSRGTNIINKGDGTFRITGETASIDGLSIDVDEEIPIGVRFEYNGGVPYPQYYHYDMIQTGGIGGVTFQLRMPVAADPGPGGKKALPASRENATLSAITLEARPNPTASSATIGYRLPEPMTARLAIYDVTGQLVQVLVPEQQLAAGAHTIQWDGADATGTPVESGLYIYRLETPAGVVNRQLRIVR